MDVLSIGFMTIFAKSLKIEGRCSANVPPTKKALRNLEDFLWIFVGPVGLEPTTP